MIDFLRDQKWIVYVLPGFVALFVAGFISDLPQVRDVMIPFVYVALTFLSLLIPLALAHIYAKVTKKNIPVSDLPHNTWFVSAVFVSSVFWGFAFGSAHSTDFVSGWLRSVLGKDAIIVSSHTEPLRLLFREAYDPSSRDGFDGVPETLVPGAKKEINTYLRITYGAGDTIAVAHGVATKYNGASERRQVYLSPACTGSGKDIVPVPGPGLWIDLEHVYSVEFIYASCSLCDEALVRGTGFVGPSIRQCPFSQMQ